MKFVYIAGPYSGSYLQQQLNILKATMAGAYIKEKLGLFPIIPHANSANLDIDGPKDYDFWVEGYLKMLEIFHNSGELEMLYVIGEWPLSEGTQKEVELARELGIKIVFEGHEDE